MFLNDVVMRIMRDRRQYLTFGRSNIPRFHLLHVHVEPSAKDSLIHKNIANRNGYFCFQICITSRLLLLQSKLSFGEMYFRVSFFMYIKRLEKNTFILKVSLIT